MKSAYGRKVPPPDDLTIVEPGSPMGELMRRYWQPVCTSDELRDLPKKVRILRLTLLAWSPPRASVEVVCGPGTYVRSLAADLGAADITADAD